MYLREFLRSMRVETQRMREERASWEAGEEQADGEDEPQADLPQARETVTFGPFTPPRTDPPQRFDFPPATRPSGGARPRQLASPLCRAGAPLAGPTATGNRLSRLAAPPSLAGEPTLDWLYRCH